MQNSGQLFLEINHRDGGNMSVCLRNQPLTAGIEFITKTL